VELTRPGLPVPVDERPYRIVAVAEAKPADHKVSLLRFRLEAISPDRPAWTQLGCGTSRECLRSSRSSAIPPRRNGSAPRTMLLAKWPGF
jgi:hypothetical protein